MSKTSSASASSQATMDMTSLIKGLAKAVQPKEKLLLPKMKKSNQASYLLWKKDVLTHRIVHCQTEIDIKSKR